MKVLIIADPLDNQRAGIHVYLRGLVDQLARQETEHEYILVRERVDPDLPLRQVALPNTRLPIGYASFRLFVLIPRLARKLKVDAVFEPAHFGPFNLPGSIKRITMIHDLTPILFGEFHRWHSQFLQKTFLKGILKRTHLVLTNSHNTQRDVERVYPFIAGKTAMIHLGLSEQFKPVETKVFQKRLGLERPYFLFVGTIEPRKNLGLLLDAYDQFREAHTSPVDLVIVGQKGWKSEAFYEQLAQHPYRADIHLPGFLHFEQLLEAYSHSLALIYPSIYEGFGFPVLEALACGTNVICSDNSSLPEVGGELAYYIADSRQQGSESSRRTGIVRRRPSSARPPTDDTRPPRSLTNLMLEIAQQTPEVLRRRAAGSAWATRFSWEKYVEVFERTLD
ncbi:MAG: glycosyltransferase family 1 protein [Bacteroidota bacterium]